MTPNELLQRAAEAARFAYAPHSKYPVGAALLLPCGSVVTGCNVENDSYGLTNCAERTAIFKAVSEGHPRFEAVAIVALDDRFGTPSPCGACRQVMAQFCDANTPVYVALAGKLEDFTESTIGKLLPLAFGK